MYKRNFGESEEENKDEELVLGLIIIFFNEGKIKRISLKDQPEIWAGLIEVQNPKGKIRPWHIYEILTVERRKDFKSGELRIGGDVFKYYRENNTKEVPIEKWQGKFVGYPLVDIANREKIKSLSGFNRMKVIEPDPFLEPELL